MSIIIDFARKQVGKPYVFGRSGMDAYDCSGLTKRAVAQIGLDFYHGATTQWNRGHQTGVAERYNYFGESGDIKTLPTNEVALLFNQDKSRKDNLVMAHTGMYDGKGRVIQAGGYGGRGVHDNPIDMNRWSHWATLSPFWKARDISVADNTLRRGSIGEAVMTLQKSLIMLGYDVGHITKADGKYGPATENGVKKFQGEHGLPVTGFWTDADQAVLDKALADEMGPIENDDTEYILVPKTWIAKLKGIVNEVG